MQFRIRENGARAIRLISLLVLCFLAGYAGPIAWADGPQTSPSIFAPASTPARSILNLSWFVLAITGSIFVTVGGLLAWAIVRYRARETDDDSEPAQIYGSTQVELAWTVIPILIVVVLFLTTARIIFAIQDAPKPKAALDVTVVGHQFWWEFRYPESGDRHGERTARSGEQRAGSASRRFCICCRRTWITASGCRSWPARRT